MNERRLTFTVTNSQQDGERYGAEIGLEEFRVRGGIRVDPTTVQVAQTIQKVKRLASANGFESWRFDGPFRTWLPMDVLSFEGLVSDAREVRIEVGSKKRVLIWDLPVCQPAGGKDE